MKQDPWEANSFSAGSEIPHMFMKTEWSLRPWLGAQLIRILSQMNAVHAIPSLYPHVCAWAKRRPLSSEFLASFFWVLPCRIPRRLHTSSLDNPSLLSQEFKSWSSSLRSFLHFRFTSFLSGPILNHSILFWHTISLCSSHYVRH
jgi:hypothetical protein